MNARTVLLPWVVGLACLQIQSFFLFFRFYWFYSQHNNILCQLVIVPFSPGAGGWGQLWSPTTKKNLHRAGLGHPGSPSELTHTHTHSHCTLGIDNQQDWSLTFLELLQKTQYGPDIEKALYLLSHGIALQHLRFTNLGLPFLTLVPRTYRICFNSGHYWP